MMNKSELNNVLNKLLLNNFFIYFNLKIKKHKNNNLLKSNKKKISKIKFLLSLNK